MAEQSLKVLLCKSNYLPELLNLHQNIRCNLCLAVYEDDLHVLQEVADAVPIQLTNQSNLDVLKLIESILLFQNKLNKEGSKLSAIKSYLAEQLLEQGNTEYEFPMKTVDSS